MRSIAQPSLELLLISALAFGAGCSSTPSAVTPRNAALEGTSWVLAEAGDRHVAAGADQATLQLDHSLARASGFAGVNRYSASYTLAGPSLRFGVLATTRMAGTPEAEALERTILGGLAATTAWRVTGGSLSLLDENGVTLLRFDAAPPR
jgi:heat shock protein HslJ